MSTHASEYLSLLARVTQRDRETITAHWELGRLFAKYGEAVTDIAEAIGRGVTFVADHIRIAEAIRTREDLAAVLASRDDITTWTILVDWVKAGGPGQESEDEPDAPEISRQRRGRGSGGGGSGQPQGGIQVVVPQHVIKGLADLGTDPRETLRRFFLNATPRAIFEMAYPDRHAPAFTSALAVPFTEPEARITV